MTLIDACAAAMMDPFARYTGAMTKCRTLAGRDYWLIWVNEEWDPIVRRWFPATDYADGEVTMAASMNADTVETGWQPVTTNTSELFKQFLDSHILDITFRLD